jgi:hypothetical protein
MAEANGDPLLLRPKQSRDGAVPSGNSAALHALAALALRSDQARYRNAADALLASLASQISQNPAAYPHLLIAADRLKLGETGSLQYAAAGKLRITASLQPASKPLTSKQSARQLSVQIDIAPGWHINAHQPHQSDLIGTDLSLPADSEAHLGAIDWPQPIERHLDFLDTPLALYQGQLSIQTTLTRPATIELRLQACSEQVCLPPETVSLALR